MRTEIEIDKETGEVIKESEKIYTLEDIKQRKLHADKAKEKEQFKEIQKEVFGNFVFFIFNNIDKLTKVLNDSELTRFIYLGTYVKNDGILKLDNNKTFITKANLHKVLNISYETSNRLYNKLIDNNLMIESGEVLYILNYFHYGKAKRYEEITETRLKNYTRIYIKTTRTLYESTSVRNHGKLAIAYKLLPYVHWKYNILCRNPLVELKENLDVLDINDVLEISGYSKENKSKFKNYFYSIECDGYDMFAGLEKKSRKSKNTNYDTTKIYVNPLIFYRGSNDEDLKALFDIFEIKVS